jgi:hypothetical protein
MPILMQFHPCTDSAKQGLPALPTSRLTSAFLSQQFGATGRFSKRKPRKAMEYFSN